LQQSYFLLTKYILTNEKYKKRKKNQATQHRFFKNCCIPFLVQPLSSSAAFLNAVFNLLIYKPFKNLFR